MDLKHNALVTVCHKWSKQHGNNWPQKELIDIEGKCVPEQPLVEQSHRHKRTQQKQFQRVIVPHDF